MFNNEFGGMFDDDRTYDAREKAPDYGLQERPVPKHYTSVADIDLAKALADQFAEAESFRDHMLNNSNAVKPTDVTSAFTSINRVIQQIVVLKKEVQNLARMQAHENAVIEIMKTQPDSIKIAFFAKLEEKLKNVQ